MVETPREQTGNKRSLSALEAANFLLADVQTGLRPFLAAYLAGAGWEPGRLGVAMTVGSAVTVLLQAPASALVDRHSVSGRRSQRHLRGGCHLGGRLRRALVLCA